MPFSPFLPSIRVSSVTMSRWRIIRGSSLAPPADAHSAGEWMTGKVGSVHDQAKVGVDERARGRGRRRPLALG